MSYAARLIHDLTLLRIPRDITVLDDYNQPTEATPVETAVRGLVQPRNARELADLRSAGAQVGDHVIFLEIMDIDASDALVYDGDRYQITGIRKFAFGSSPHLEVDAQKVDITPVGS